MVLALLTYALRLLGISFVRTAEESLVLEVGPLHHTRTV